MGTRFASPLCCLLDDTIPPSLVQLEGKGLELLMKEERQLSREEAAEFYKQHEGSVSIAPLNTCTVELLYCGHLGDLVKFPV